MTILDDIRKIIQLNDVCTTTLALHFIRVFGTNSLIEKYELTILMEVFLMFIYVFNPVNVRKLKQYDLEVLVIRSM